MRIKNILKCLLPPILVIVYKKLVYKTNQGKNNVVKQAWSGNYANWSDALSLTTGYQDDLILEKCKSSLLKVKNGTAIYERDSVLFDEIQYSWGLLACLQNIAIENDNNLCILDFGGSLGSTYYQNLSFLSKLKTLEWLIVEQKHFVDCGKKHFEDDHLKFHYSIETCFLKHKPSVLLLSGVLQNLENPTQWIEKFNNLNIDYIVIDRTTSINEENILTIQNVPDYIYNASYPCWFFNANFIEKNLNQFDLVASFDNHADAPNYILNGDIVANWKGYLYKRKNNL